MDTLLIELTNPKAFDLVKDLEALNVLRIMSRQTVESSRLSERFAGKLSADTAKALQQHIQQSRSEWESRDI
nr:hypothetical protein [uncultured Arsenicibacter sp.]